MQGDKVVEVRPAGTSKGVACQAFLSRGYDFVLGVGDDATDEDLFRVLPPSAYSIRVGLTQSYARYNVADQAEALRLVESLAATPPDRASMKLPTGTPCAAPSVYGLSWPKAGDHPRRRTGESWGG